MRSGAEPHLMSVLMASKTIELHHGDATMPAFMDVTWLSGYSRALAVMNREGKARGCGQRGRR